MSEFQDFVDSHYERQQGDPRGWFRWAAFMYKWQTARWFMGLLNNLEVCNMARGKKGQNGAAERRSGASVWFVNVAVSVNDEGKIADFLPSADAVYDAMVEVMTSGYRVGFNYDMSRDAVICSLTCRDDKSPNNGGVLNAFAGDWFTALRVVLYKHYVILNEVWNETDAAASRPLFG